MKKLASFYCPMGKIKRYITCVSIDLIDNFAFCGTRSGDVLEVSLTKGIYSRSGPVDKKLKGAVNHVSSKFKNLYLGTSEGKLVKVDKKTLNIIGEVDFPNSSITGISTSESKLYSITDRSVVRGVLDSATV